ncbi:thiol reductant ABC exporter subunit CydC [Mycolicibacterium mengxianglii]|uniref:thiol reductant ABC exporter subunit CydC n=1 Tax=Mycolicibacterium mengxianglii TaxID=2736649 RepID=UPI0018EEE124|nr:thiol reductant ABC exporter subunit CydC [Mycolicibacterium mengxianglii]
MLRSDPLIRALPLLRPRLPRLLLATLCGVLSLGSALALAGVSAWLITRAWQMPPILDLSVAVVAVRTFGISRGVLHYCERLASHDAALRASGTARSQIYRSLAAGPVDVVARLDGGELAGRVGADVDDLADVLVRAVLPVAVATILSVAAVVVIALISGAAALVLAVCLAVAGVLAPWLSARGASAQETAARELHAQRDVMAMLALEHAAELRVSGRLSGIIAESDRRQRDWGSALDGAARPAAVGAAVPTAAVGVSVLGAVVAALGIGATAAPTTLAILMLLPLSAFEAVTALPAAAIQLTRSRIAARRLLELTDPGAVARTAVAHTGGAARPEDLTVRGDQLVAGFSADSAGPPVTVELPPGTRFVVQGPSGSGKTTLLMTLAGMLPPVRGTVELGGVPLASLDEDQLRSAVAFFAEDAHVFATTVRDNLLVARGDCTDAELRAALTDTGLRDWLDTLPAGLDTVLDGGASALSAGQRRRLLLARVLLCPAPVVLLDEPTEHLDISDADAILTALLRTENGLLGRDRTVVVATHHLPSDFADSYTGPHLTLPARSSRRVI